MQPWKTVNSKSVGNLEIFTSVSQFSHDGVVWGRMMRETYDRSCGVPHYSMEYNTIHPTPQQVH